ncbi:hypothetical protein FQA39_LY06182 [Lamprigera yunnana]|nr:hypothetical protein FQA39_LY06182 [Lamprigera yunnana]
MPNTALPPELIVKKEEYGLTYKIFTHKIMMAFQSKLSTYPQDNEEKQYANQDECQRYEEYAAEDEYSPQRRPPRQKLDYEQEEVDDYYEKGDSPSINNHQKYSPPLQRSRPQRKSIRMIY